MTTAGAVISLAPMIAKVVVTDMTSLSNPSSPSSQTVEVRAGGVKRETEGVRTGTGSTHPHPMHGEGMGVAGTQGTTGVATTTTTTGGGVRGAMVDTEARRMATKGYNQG